MHKVTLGVLEGTFKRHLEKFKDKKLAFSAACNELGIPQSERRALSATLDNQKLIHLAGEWQSRPHRPHWTEERENLNEQNREGIPPITGGH